jgi:hypothetical protein
VDVLLQLTLVEVARPAGQELEDPPLLNVVVEGGQGVPGGLET